MPKQFDANVLNQLTHAQEIHLETHSSTGQTHRTIVWVASRAVYVRSVRGSNGRWYQEIPALETVVEARRTDWAAR